MEKELNNLKVENIKDLIDIPINKKINLIKSRWALNFH